MFLYETTCHIISYDRILGEESYDPVLGRHLRKMGKENWELVSVQKATQVLSLSPSAAAELTPDQISGHNVPREVFVFFWKKPVDSVPDELD